MQKRKERLAMLNYTLVLILWLVGSLAAYAGFYLYYCGKRNRLIRAFAGLLFGSIGCGLSSLLCGVWWHVFAEDLDVYLFLSSADLTKSILQMAMWVLIAQVVLGGLLWRYLRETNVDERVVEKTFA